MANYTDVFTGSIVQPTDVSYYNLTLTGNVQLVWPTYYILSTTVPAARNIDVTPTGAGYNIALPQGNLGSLGVDILFTNRGSAPFNVTDYLGQNSTTVAAGKSIYFYLQDNTTLAGFWRTTNFGVGTGSADANALAGYGLTSITGKLSETLSITQFSLSNYPLADASRASGYVWTGGAGSLSMPAAATLSPGWFIYLRNQGSGSLTITTVGTSLINGSTQISYDIGTSQLIAFDANSNNFFTYGTVNTQNFALSSATYDVSSIVGTGYSLVLNAPIIQRYIDFTSTRSQNLLVTLPATANLYALINATGSSAYTLSFQLSGSAQTPIVVAPNTQAFIASDGISLYILNTTVLGGIQLNDGTAAAPTLNFLSETNTGLYKAGGYQPAFAVGGQNILTLNGSDPNNKRVISPAAATFRSISGGLI